MSNLIKAAEELEYVPKEDLIRMAESGDSRFPPYLVLSEIYIAKIKKTLTLISKMRL